MDPSAAELFTGNNQLWARDHRCPVLIEKHPCLKLINLKNSISLSQDEKVEQSGSVQSATRKLEIQGLSYVANIGFDFRRIPCGCEAKLCSRTNQFFELSSSFFKIFFLLFIYNTSVSSPCSSLFVASGSCLEKSKSFIDILHANIAAREHIVI